MKRPKVIIYLTMITFLIVFTLCSHQHRPHYIFSVQGEKTFLNGQEFLIKGLRLSNTLVSDEAVDKAIAFLDTFALYGLNSFSVYFQGSRFGDIKGYREDATLDPV